MQKSNKHILAAPNNALPDLTLVALPPRPARPETERLALPDCAGLALAFIAKPRLPPNQTTPMPP